MSEDRSLEHEIELLKGELDTATWALSAAFRLLTELGDAKFGSLVFSQVEGLTISVLKDDRREGAERFRNRLVEIFHGREPEVTP